MKKQVAYLLIASLAITPTVLNTGCSVMHGKESAGAYAKDKEIATRIKTSLYGDPTTKGTEIKVQALNGIVELSGFVDSQNEKERAGQIASSAPGVVEVHNNLLVPTGR